MSPQGDEQRPGGPDEPERPEPPDQGEPERPEKPEKPEYTVYGSKGGKAGRKQEAPEGEAPEGPKAPVPPGRPSKPEYKVYRSRPSLRDRLRKPDLAGLKRPTPGWRSKLPSGGDRHWLRWVLIAIFGWLLISFVAFAVSAQIQKGKLDDPAKEALAGGPDVLAGQNILILGGDRRGENQENAQGTELQGPPRADTIMVLHASLTSFRKLSIPRDTYASIPDCGEQRINASLACNTNSLDGNPASTIRTVSDFLGIDINHIVIIDFDGFADFINTLGGIEVKIKSKVCGDVDGGKKQGGVSIQLPPGEHTLQGDKALALARIRKNECQPSEDDTDRAARQQVLLNGIKGRLTSITADSLQLHQGTLDRLERAEGVHQRHGRAHPAPGRDGGDLRRQRLHERPRPRARWNAPCLARPRRQPGDPAGRVPAGGRGPDGRRAGPQARVLALVRGA